MTIVKTKKVKPLVTIIIGTRPEAIKLSPVILNFKQSALINTRVVITGQHKDLVLPILKIFGITPDSNLNLMAQKQSLNHITTNTLNLLKIEFSKYMPDLVLVQGDTSTAFSAALAAFYEKIPIGHIEAGLRTDQIMNPFPEEGNRRLISQLASIHFAPTKKAAHHLKESKVFGEIYLTGNTVIDSILYVKNKKPKLNFLEQFKTYKKIILATVHRRENWGGNIRDIAKGFLDIVNNNKNAVLIFPLHPNPLISKNFREFLGNHDRILLHDALPYDELVSLMDQAEIILTDSGGIQEEAPSFNTPVLVLRENTERPEAIESGTAKLVGTDSKKIFQEANLLLNNKEAYTKMSNIKNPFGDGKASERILKASIKFILKN